jgi:hypothetical protein
MRIRNNLIVLYPAKSDHTLKKFNEKRILAGIFIGDILVIYMLRDEGSAWFEVYMAICQISA